MTRQAHWFFPLISLALLAGCASAPETETETTEVAPAADCDASQADWAGLTEAADEGILEGVVHGSFTDEDALGGFFMHYPDDPTQTFFVASNDDINTGDQVRFAAVVQGEFQGGLQVEATSDITTCNSGVTIASSDLSLPVDYRDELHQRVHQRVVIPHPMTVIGHYNLARWGTLELAPERLWAPTQVRSPGRSARELAARNNLQRITLNDGSLSEYPETVRFPAPGLHIENPVRTGDQVDNLEGILVYADGTFQLQPVTEPDFTTRNPRPEAPERHADADLRLVSFNVLNYFNGDGRGGGFPTERGADTPEEFERQRTRIIAAMVELDADIYGLMEMENDGFSPASALADLTRGLNREHPEGQFSYVILDSDQVGNDAITQAIVYRSDRVSEIGRAAYFAAGPFDWGSRPPLAQSFRVNETGAELTVVANHFKSKGSCPDDDPDNAAQRDGQGCWNQHRLASAQTLLNWLQENPTGVEHDQTVLLGDFNAYALEDPIAELELAGYVNVAGSYRDEPYSYVFQGERGSLDHILAHTQLLPAVVDFDIWHINADEPIAFEYPLANKTSAQQDDWYAPEPWRASDHDPLVLDLNSAAFAPADDAPRIPLFLNPNWGNAEVSTRGEQSW